MATNTLLSPTVIAKEALFQLRNNLVMGMIVHKEYKKEFVKIGNTVTIRKPVKFVSTSGATLSKQDVTEGSTTIVVNNRKHVAWGFLSEDLTLTIEDYAERYIQPAGIRLANDVDAALTGLYSSLWSSAGTPGTTPNSFSSLATVARYLDEAAVPDDGQRKLVLDPDARWAMADALKGIYDNSMPKELVRKGLLGQIANFQIYGDQNVPMHANGARGGTPLVNGANQHSNTSPQANTQTLNMDGASNSITNWAKAGDVFTIASVNSVNPVSKSSTGRLAQFVVTANANSNGSGQVALTIAPAIVSSGAYQNVSAVPGDNAAMTFLGNASAEYRQNLGFHKNALALVTCPLILPDGASFKARVQHEGVSCRVVKDFSIVDDEDIIRIDMLFGVKAIYPDLGARLWG